MICKLDDIDLSTFGAILLDTGEVSTFRGEFDLPRRKGETERNWGTEIEPYVDSNDIELDGRNLKFYVLIEGNSYNDYQSKLNAFKKACITCHTLSSHLGQYNVVLKDDVTVEEEYGCNMATVTVTFWQELVTLPSLSLIGSGGIGFLLDEYNLYRDFHIVVSNRKNNENTGRRIDVNTTLPYTRTTYRDRTTVILSCAMVGDNLSNLYAKMMQLEALCMKTGLRTLTFPDRTQLSLYFKEGITVKVEHESIITFDLKMRIV